MFDEKCDKIEHKLDNNKKMVSFNNSSKVNANRHHNNKFQAVGSVFLNDNENDDRKFNYKKNLISKKINSRLYSLPDLYRNETKSNNDIEIDLKSQISVNNNAELLNIINNDNGNSSDNNCLNESETTTITLSVSSCSSNSDNDIDDEEDDENTNDNDEFLAIFKRISINKLNNEANLNDKHVNSIATSKNNFNNESNTNINNNGISTLKNLFKLLKLYKLEHYMNDLVDSNYSSTISLHKLKQNDLDKLNVSPYDKKKFIKLQIFIKQVMNTISLSQATKTIATGRRSSSCSNNANRLENTDTASSLMDNKIKKMITIKKAHSSNNKPKILIENNNPNASPKSASSSNLLAGRCLPRNFSGTILNNENATPNWSKEATKPPATSKLFTKNPNLPAQHTMNRMKRVIKASSVNNNKHNRFSLVQRAKSSEPALKKSASNNLAPSIASKSTTLIDNQTGVGVNHPTQISRNNTSKKLNDEYFGPKLQLQQNEICNIQLIKTNTYNYGVPQVETVVNKKSKSLIRKSKSSHQLEQQVNIPSLVTTDIYVYARKRPKLPCESKFNDVVVVEDDSEKMKTKKGSSICVNETKTAVDGTPILRKNEFQFDKIFDANQTNQEIFKSSIQSFIDQPAENRDDFTCICFGQTGSGKTHTLFGNKQQDGLCVLTAESLFQNNERLICGFYEIYNGQLYDLLNQKNRLVLREDSNSQVNVVGLVEVEIKTLGQLRKTIESAQANRHIGCTSFNKASSRSHAVIQFKVPNVSSHPSSSGQVIMNKQQIFTNNLKNKSKIVQPRPFRVLFIDLAGSERGIDAQTNQNDNRKEGAEINQSLLALKECIRCIDQFCSHAPFRQSKLTRVLRDCFIGYGRTVLIATVSPTDDCVSCSINTLQYANRVRQMTLRNRARNEKWLSNNKQAITNKNEQTKATANFKSVNSDLPPTSDKKNKKNYKDIFYEEDINSNNNIKNFVSSSPISNLHFNSKELHANQTNSTNVLQKSSTTSNLKMDKPTVPSLFHPSKINMSSTPIKTVNPSHSIYASHADDLLFENDTPIKGHKIKYIANSQPMVQLAERYFARVNMPESSTMNPNKKLKDLINGDDLNSKMYFKTKNDDAESGVESEELNKSSDQKSRCINAEGFIQQPKIMSNHQLFSSNSNRLSSFVSKSSNQSSNVDDSLSRLRRKQKELIESKKYLNGFNFEETDSNRFENTEIDSTLLFQNELANKSKINEPGAQQQTHLKSYIQNLEYKLQNLRNEMNDNQENKMNKEQRERSLSTDSCDSLQEIKKNGNQLQNRSKNLAILQEFVQQRTQLENHQKKLNNMNTENEDKRKSFNSQSKKFGEEHEELFFKLQKQQNGSFEHSNHLFENSIGSTSSDDNNNPDLNNLKKSMHKGVGSTAFLLSKMKKSFTTSSPTAKSEKQIFSPIIKVENQNLDNKGNSSSFDNDSTPRNNCQLVNPIPIRLSASSSIDSTQMFEENNPLNSSRLSFNKSLNDGVLTPSKLKISNSKIWKSTSIASPIQAVTSNDKKTWSTLLASNNEKQTFKLPLQNNESVLSHLSGFETNNRVQVYPNDLNRFKTNDLLVVAHENQLSDITETCKKEMNLLSCLRESQMGFDEYLNKVEEMLSQKAHSIRDLQYQIIQLKHIKHAGIKNDITEQII